MKERIFVNKAKEQIGLEEYIRDHFKYAKCGEIEVQHTPIVTRIIVHTTTPGVIIGTGGERIGEAIKKLKENFSIENPQIDVQKITNPDCDPFMVSQNIATSIENGVNFNRLGNYYVTRIMNAGAIGCELLFKGKFSGQRARTERFSAGYLKKCGKPSEQDVIRASRDVVLKLGKMTVTVKIMIRNPDEALKNVRKSSKEYIKEQQKQAESYKEQNAEPEEEEQKEKQEKAPKKPSKKKKGKKTEEKTTPEAPAEKPTE